METLHHEAEVSTSPNPVLNGARSDLVTVVSPLKSQATPLYRLG